MHIGGPLSFRLVMNIKVLLRTPEKGWFLSPGLLLSRSELLSGYLSKNVVVFMVPDPNLHVLIPDTLSFTCFAKDPVFLWAQKMLGS